MLINHWKVPKNLIKKSNIDMEDYNILLNKLLLERYFSNKKPISIKLPFVYNKIPVFLRNFLYKILLKFKKDPKFPHWPIESKVEDLRKEFIQKLKRNLKKKIPYIKFWPKGEFALVLTHDMDTKSSFNTIEKIREIERKFNLKSSWNVVTHKYKIDFNKLKELKKEGCEIGIHGYNHDGRLTFLEENKIKGRLKFSLNKLKEFNTKGFRSPQLQTTEKFLNLLQDYFLYDSSMADTDIKSIVGVRSGCCTIFPYFIGKLVELPLTISQEYRMFYTLNLTDDEILKIWKEKINYIIKNNGLVLINAHPDKYLSGSKRGLRLYEEILKYISKFKFYHDLPVNVAKWWIERNKCQIKNKKIIGSRRARLVYF